MIKYYIITWAVVSWHSVACPLPAPTVDKFGRVTQSNIQDAVLCGETDTTWHKKRIDKRDSAFIFYNDALDESKKTDFPYDLDGPGIIQNVKIDSVKKIIIR